MTPPDQTARKTVYVVDDNVDVRKSLHFALQFEGFTVWPFSGPEDFLEALQTLTPAPVLLDIRMPNIDGVQLLEMIRQRGIDWPVIMMTAHGEIPIAVTAMKLGAFDFLEKPFDLKALEELLDKAFDRLKVAVAKSRRRDDSRSAVSKLSPRELEVANRMVLGERSKEIALALGISHRTVEIHRGSVMAKLGTKSLAEAVRVLIDAGEAAEGQ